MQNIINEVINTPVNERVQLAELLLESVDITNEHNNKLWIDEVKKRMISAQNGETALLNFDEIC